MEIANNALNFKQLEMEFATNIRKSECRQRLEIYFKRVG